MARPVTNRSASADGRLSTASARMVLAMTPPTMLPSMSRRGDQTSGRLPSALASVPTMKPSCTAIVRPARPEDPSDHSRERAGSTADALNHRDSANSSASDRAASARQRPATAGWLLDDALGAKPGDLLAAQAERREHLLGVLAADGRRGAHGSRRLRELDGHAELSDLAELRMLDVDDHLAVVHLGIADHLLRIVDLAHADIGLDEQLVPFVAGARLDDRLDLAPRAFLFGIGGADELIGLARELQEIRPADGLAEVLPQPRLGAGDREQLVVARLVDRVVRV